MKIKWLALLLIVLFSYNGYSQKIDWNVSIPEYISATSAKLSLNKDFVKEGTASLQWQWFSPSVLTVDNPSLLQKAVGTRKGGLTMWVYNDEPVNAALRISFVAADGSIPYWFDYHLGFSGWRACWITFENMQGDHKSKELVRWTMTTPENLKTGTLLLDRVEFPAKGVHHQATPDYQTPLNNTKLSRTLWHWARLYEWEHYEYDLPLASVGSSQRQDIELLSRRLTDQVAPETGKGNATRALSIAEKANIHRVDGKITGAPLVSNDELNKKAGEIGLSDLETMLFGFAGDWYYNKNKESKQAFFDVFEYAMQQGFAFGSGLGTNHHYGYQIRDIYKAAWMMRDLLKEETPLNKNIRRTLAYWSGLAETRIPYQYGRDELLDSWNTLLTAKVISALIQPDMRDQVRSMKALSRWVSGSLGFTPGTIGGIKVDGTTFHHGGLYPAYSIGAFATIGKYLELTNHTEFTISDDAARNVKLALQTMRNYCNLKDWGLGIAGRHPFDGSISNDAVQTFALLADRGDLTGSGNKIDEELAADYLRLNRTSSPYKRKFEQAGIKAASSPQGFFAYNYGALGIHRFGNWMVTLKGYNTDVWCSEIYTKDNRYGRYQSYGSVQILASGRPVNSFASGFVEDGWDWNRVPGTTTIHLPLEKLENPLLGTLMERSEENFSGASSLEGKQGVFVFKLKEKDRENFTPGFVARKSVFCFENRLVCLGSNISNNNKEYPTETTLFQLALKRNSEPILLGSDTIVGLPIEKTISEKSSVLLSDTKGNYYRIAAGQDLRILRQKQKSRDNKQKSETEGKFVTAYLNHGVSPDNAEYEYMVLVQPTPDQAKEIASEEGLPYQILRKDHYAHIVKDIPSGTVGYVMFETLDNIKDDYLLASDAETLILLRPTDKKTLVMSICDPNLNLEEKTYTTAKPSRPLIKSILLKGKWKNVSDNDEVVIKQENGNTRLTATCIDGRPVEFKLIAQ